MRFIGVYDYTVILSYISLAASVAGVLLASGGRMTAAVLCLAFSGICDAFDGKIARTKKNRTEDEKNFGIQLDSLCDVLCFGLFPAFLCYKLGVDSAVGLVIVCGYCICAVIRLAFFNVIEGKRQQTEGGSNKAYRGMPVTTVSILLPVIYWVQYLIPEQAFVILLHVLLASCGFLFVLDFRMPKPNGKMILLMIAAVAAIVGTIAWITK